MTGTRVTASLRYDRRHITDKTRLEDRLATGDSHRDFHRLVRVLDPNLCLAITPGFDHAPGHADDLVGDLVGRIEGKSSLGRLGLMVHSTAGYIDPGFRGKLTLELSNHANLPILLWPQMRIGQLSVMQLSSSADRPYGSPELASKYQDQAESTPSRSHLGFE